MKNKIILSAIFLIAVLVNIHVFTDAFSDTAIPKFRPFGTSTTFADSTNYVTLNKGFYTRDSIKTDNDLIVKGHVVLDTTRQITIGASGLDLSVINAKVGGHFITSVRGANSSYDWYYSPSTSDVLMMNLDTSGLLLSKGNISLAGTTQQIKLPSDTASDYDANDAITLNRQSGILTTKSLTTATDNFYTFTLTNSLITTTSKVFLSYCGGTESAGRPTVYRVVSNSGSATCILLNLTGAGSFNGNVKLNFVVFN